MYKTFFSCEKQIFKLFLIYVEQPILDHDRTTQNVPWWSWFVTSIHCHDVYYDGLLTLLGCYGILCQLVTYLNLKGRHLGINYKTFSGCIIIIHIHK